MGVWPLDPFLVAAGTGCFLSGFLPRGRLRGHSSVGRRLQLLTRWVLLGLPRVHGLSEYPPPMCHSLSRGGRVWGSSHFLASGRGGRDQGLEMCERLMPPCRWGQPQV